MPKKIKLNLEDLNVESFKTSNEEKSKGGKSALTFALTVASYYYCSDLDIICEAD